MELPFTIDEIKNKLQGLVKINNINTGTIYIQVTRGATERDHYFTSNLKPIVTAYTTECERPFSQFNEGIKATLVADERWLRCDIKSLNLLGNVLAKYKAKSNDYNEAILYRDEIITEGSSTNVFMIIDGKVKTHEANNYILEGITRNEVIDIAQRCGIPVSEETFTTKELLDADEVFVTSTTIEITPVIQIDDQKIGSGIPGQITMQLQKEFHQLLK